MANSQPMGEGADSPTLLAQSMEELRLRTAGHDGTWHLGHAVLVRIPALRVALLGDLSAVSG